ncbi:MAG: hypothetical protein WCQ47_06725 [bacterium]
MNKSYIKYLLAVTMILLLSSCLGSSRLHLGNNEGPVATDETPVTTFDDTTTIATLPVPPGEYFPSDSELYYGVLGESLPGQRVSQLRPYPSSYPLRKGEVKVVTFLINIDTLAQQALTREKVDELVFGTTPNKFSVNSFIEKTSGGVAHLSGHTYGPYTSHLDADKNISNRSQYCQEIIDQAKAQAVADGFNAADYSGNTIFLYLVPGNLWVCSGCGSSAGGLNFAVVGGVAENNAYSNYALVHEFGHGLGLHHDSQMTCKHNGVAVTIGDECVVSEYGDNFSAMGGSSSLTMPAVYSAQAIAKMGWKTPLLVTSSGSYEVSPLDRDTIEGIPQIIQIPRGLSIKSYYYVYRKVNLAGEIVPADGIFVQLSRGHTVGQFYTPAILKMHPNGAQNDVMLRAGESFTDPQTGLVLTLNWINPQSIDNGSADISVVYPTRSLTKPSTPNVVSSSVVGTDISVVWDQSTDAFGYGINEYQVTINDPVHPYNDVVFPHVLCSKNSGSGVYSGTVPSVSGCEQIKFTKGRLPNNVDLFIRVQSRDLSNNLSEPSAPVSLKIPYGADITPPKAPSNLVATDVSTQGVTLSWDPATDNIGVTGSLLYRVGYPDATHMNPVVRNITGTTTRTVARPGYLFESGKTYILSVVPYDAAGNRGDTADISVTIP